MPYAGQSTTRAINNSSRKYSALCSRLFQLSRRTERYASFEARFREKMVPEMGTNMMSFFSLRTLFMFARFERWIIGSVTSHSERHIFREKKSGHFSRKTWDVFGEKTRDIFARKTPRHFPRKKIASFFRVGENRIFHMFFIVSFRNPSDLIYACRVRENDHFCLLFTVRFWVSETLCG